MHGGRYSLVPALAPASLAACASQSSRSIRPLKPSVVVDPGDLFPLPGRDLRIGPDAETVQHLFELRSDTGNRLEIVRLFGPFDRDGLAKVLRHQRRGSSSGSVPRASRPSRRGLGAKVRSATAGASTAGAASWRHQFLVGAATVLRPFAAIASGATSAAMPAPLPCRLPRQVPPAHPQQRPPRRQALSSITCSATAADPRQARRPVLTPVSRRCRLLRR